MVAIIKSSQNIRRTVLYNEQKITEERALFLGAFNYWQDDAQLTLEDKLQRFDDLVILNERSHAHTIHISLNFHPDDQLTDKKMRHVASAFMERIEFSDQPWLAYRHIDAGHPHMHIVTTNIRPDGDRITNDLRSPRLLVRYCSELEELYSLTPAKEHLSPRQLARLQPDQESDPEQKRLVLTHNNETRRGAQRLHYGQSATKTGIEGVLDHVLPHYAYTSLDHLNALLSLYHVRADRGSEEGVMYQNRGLYYRMIDECGKKIGAPIKASSFDTQPTLNYLEERFQENSLRQHQRLQHAQTAIEWTLRTEKVRSLRQFNESLEKERIRLVIPHLIQKRQRQEQPFFYIDWENKTVYRDVELGQHYTAAAVLKRTGLEQDLLTLVAEQKLHLSRDHDRDMLQSPDPDPVHRLNILLSLTGQHNQLVAQQLKEEQAERLHHHLRHRLSNYL